MKVTCPKNSEHNLFTATIDQWEVNSIDQLWSILEDIEVSLVPPPNSTWVCKECGAEAIVDNLDGVFTNNLNLADLKKI